MGVYVYEWLEYVQWLWAHCLGDVRHAMAHLFTMFQEMKELALI